MEKRLFRVGEAADFLSVSRWTIYRWLEQGKLKGTKIGKGSTRVFRESLDGLIQDNCTDDHTLKQPSELPLAAAS
jgi:excisionase family DNA binding protein